MPVKLTPLQVFQRDKFFVSSALKGIGANKTIAAAKAIGLPIRRTDGLALYRNYAGIPVKESRMKFVRKSLRYSRDLFIEQERFMTRRYRYTKGFEVRVEETGEIKNYYRSIISDTPLTPAQVDFEADQAMENWYEDPPGAVTKSWVHKIEHRKGDSWDT